VSGDSSDSDGVTGKISSLSDAIDGRVLSDGVIMSTMGALLCNRCLESSLTIGGAIAIGERVSSGALVCNRCLESSLTTGAIGGDNADDDGDCEGDGVDDDGEEALAVCFMSACSSS
jgi:hypothetical protein